MNADQNRPQTQEQYDIAKAMVLIEGLQAEVNNLKRDVSRLDRALAAAQRNQRFTT